MKLSKQDLMINSVKCSTKIEKHKESDLLRVHFHQYVILHFKQSFSVLDLAYTLTLQYLRHYRIKDLKSAVHTVLLLIPLGLEG